MSMCAAVGVCICFKVWRGDINVEDRSTWDMSMVDWRLCPSSCIYFNMGVPFPLLCLLKLGLLGFNVDNFLDLWYTYKRLIKRGVCVNKLTEIYFLILSIFLKSYSFHFSSLTDNTFYLFLVFSFKWCTF